jgi:uncharacterized tellurite resistance protein B-like protein
MIIFGTRHLRSTVSTGSFFCPACKQRTGYKYIENKEYGHLFFIPLLPLGSDGEYVECQRCGRPFHPDVLRFDPEEEQRQFARDFQKLALKCMQLVAAVDTSISPVEAQTISLLYKQISGEDITSDWVMLEGDRLRYLPNEVHGQVKRLAPNLSENGKEMLIRVLILVAFCDNRPEQVEYDCILNIAQELGVTQAHFRGIMQTTLNIEGPDDSAL